MKTLPIGVMAATLLLGACQQDGQKANVQLTSNIDSVSYGIGTQIGTNVRKDLKRAELDSVDVQLVMAGFQHAMDSVVTVPQDKLDAAVRGYMMQLRDKKLAEENAKAEEALKKGQEWLAENGKRQGVTTTASGLQYEVVTMGTGPKPTMEDPVEVHYRGTLIDGQEFDSSYKNGSPAQFGLTQVIPGWAEVLQLMPVGSKWKVFIPPSLGYGAQANGEEIPANSVLVFDMELLRILPKDKK